MNIIHFEEIDSTQNEVKRVVEKKSVKDLAVVADVQIGGYGRMQRNWSSDIGGLWFSFLLRPKFKPDQTCKLALIISIALNRVLEKKFKIVTSIKWPNDLLYRGKKVSGILVEMSAKENKIDWVIVGIGINVNNDLPKELKPFSRNLKSIVGKNIDKDKLMSLFLVEFNKLYLRFCKSGFEQFVKEYNLKLALINKKIKVDNGFGIVDGINRGIDGEGKLLVEIKNNELPPNPTLPLQGEGNKDIKIVKIISGTVLKG